MLVLGDGRPLLFLHGGDAPDFPSNRVLGNLARHFRVFAPWHPGFGNIDRPKDIRDVNDLAYLYLDLTEACDLSNTVIVGASFGAWVAAEIAIRSAAAFSHLILSAPLGIKVRGREFRDIEDIFAMSDCEFAAIAYAEPRKAKRALEDLDDEQLAAHFRSKEALAFYGWKPYMHNPQLKRWLHRISIPTALLVGRQDRVVFDDYYKAYSQSIPGSRLFVIKNAGHFPQAEQPEEFTQFILDFVGSGLAPLAATSREE